MGTPASGYFGGWTAEGGRLPYFALGCQFEEEICLRLHLRFVHVHFHEERLGNTGALRGDLIFFQPEWLALKRLDSPAPRIAEAVRVEQVLVGVNDCHFKVRTRICFGSCVG